MDPLVLKYHQVHSILPCLTPQLYNLSVQELPLPHHHQDQSQWWQHHIECQCHFCSGSHHHQLLYYWQMEWKILPWTCLSSLNNTGHRRGIFWGVHLAVLHQSHALQSVYETLVCCVVGLHLLLVDQGHNIQSPSMLGCSHLRQANKIKHTRLLFPHKGKAVGKVTNKSENQALTFKSHVFQAVKKYWQQSLNSS